MIAVRSCCHRSRWRGGAFALLVPGNIRWRVSEFTGGFRLDFLPVTAKDRARRRRDRGEP